MGLIDDYNTRKNQSMEFSVFFGFRLPSPEHTPCAVKIILQITGSGR
jgi:hypothetical protein